MYRLLCTLPSTVARSCACEVHTSALLCKKHKPRAEKYARKPVTFKAKSTLPIVQVWKGMEIRELAAAMGKSEDDVFESLFHTSAADSFSSADQPIHSTTLIAKICALNGRRTNITGKPRSVVEEALGEAEEDGGRDPRDAYPQPPPPEDELRPRPPVVTIMGHVDHGKTTLLDALRKSSVVDSEFGGITQHIGAFSVKLSGGASVTFLDTPGHAAFSAMRQRGASATDIVVLVIAADDGVMEQTRESIRFARSAGVPIVVAINKVDKENADVDKAKQGLLGEELIPEEFGGDVQVVPISALKGQGLDALQDALLTQASLQGLRATSQGLAESVVVESKQEQGRGKVATLLVQRGTLKKGTWLVAGGAYARVRTIADENGKAVGEALPSEAVQVTGWKEMIPPPGELVLQVANEARAREVMSFRQAQQLEEDAKEHAVAIQAARAAEREEYTSVRDARLADGWKRIRKTHFAQMMKGFKQEVRSEERSLPSLALLLRADVEGSAEAISDVLLGFHSRLTRLDLLDAELLRADVEGSAEAISDVFLGFHSRLTRLDLLDAELLRADVEGSAEAISDVLLGFHSRLTRLDLLDAELLRADVEGSAEAISDVLLGFHSRLTRLDLLDAELLRADVEGSAEAISDVLLGFHSRLTRLDLLDAELLRADVEGSAEAISDVFLGFHSRLTRLDLLDAELLRADVEGSAEAISDVLLGFHSRLTRLDLLDAELLRADVEGSAEAISDVFLGFHSRLTRLDLLDAELLRADVEGSAEAISDVLLGFHSRLTRLDLLDAELLRADVEGSAEAISDVLLGFHSRLTRLDLLDAELLRADVEGSAEAISDVLLGFHSRLTRLDLLDAELLRADVEGSAEAISDVLLGFHSRLTRLDLLDAEVGTPTPGDVERLKLAGGQLFLFNIPCPPDIRRLAKEAKVEVKEFNIIYRLVEEIREHLASIIPVRSRAEVKGSGEVVREFMITHNSKRWPVAGCRVDSGVFARRLACRVSRGHEELYDGQVMSMRNEKVDVKEGRTGEELGILLPDRDVRFQQGDTIEFYELVEEKQALDWNPPGFS